MGINMPSGGSQSSAGRRLFAMAAPIAGMAIGGPAGAAIGSAIGGKLEGESTGDAVLGGAQNAFTRRADAQSANPHVAIAQGLDQLKGLSPELQQEYAPPLIQAQMMAENQIGQSNNLFGAKRSGI